MQNIFTNETLKNIKQRRSIRSFKDEQIKDEELQVVLEAGLYAPNAGNQPWHFTAIQNKEILNKLNILAKEAAKQMGGPLAALGNDEQFHCMYNAPTLIIVSGDEQSICPEVDCAAATQNLLIAAESIGLGSCWIFFVTLAFASSQAAELRRELQIQDGYKPYYAAVFGYKNAAAVSIPERNSNLITYIK
ncbi:nitroreductase family protein [Clostridium sp. WILCCON 0269]|uniref:Nitroreductase family protein n=1 Tax=Candidatus Clostridium eludens TaxID=3381663 RepID=A0ABW8SKP7_9CLOT